MADGVARRADVDRLAVDENAPGIERIGAEDGARGFGPSRADKAGDAEDLAALDGERDILDDGRVRVAAVAAPRQSFDRKRHWPGLGRGAMREERVHLAPDHLADDAVDARLGDRAASDQAAVAQHGVAVADLHHLLEPMRDEDDAEALRLQVADDGERASRPRCEESAEVGSSMTISRDFMERARAISTICCSATERSRTIRVGS